MTAFFPTALVDLAECSFVGAVSAVFLAIADLFRKETLAVKAWEAALVDVTARGRRARGYIAVELVRSVGAVLGAVAAPVLGDALVILTAEAGAIGTMAV